MKDDSSDLWQKRGKGRGKEGINWAWKAESRNTNRREKLAEPVWMRGGRKKRLTQSNQSKSKGEREYGIFGYLSQGLITSFTVES